MSSSSTHVSTFDGRRVSFHIPRALQALAWAPVRLLLTFFCRFKVEGTEHLKNTAHKPILFVANHQSELDAVVVRAAIPMLWKKAPLFFVSAPLAEFKDGSFSWRRWLYSTSWFFSYWGAHPAQRGMKSYEKSLETHSRILSNDNTCVLIFPEGKRVAMGEVPHLHGGAGFLATMTDVLAIPVAITGVHNMTPRSFLMRSCAVRVIFGEPIDLTQSMFPDAHNPEHSAAEHLMKQVYSHHARLSKDVPKKVR